MSTYTDLHNKVKESLNVDYHSRETNQKSLFLNPENEYWGTFHGEVDVKGASINNGVLSDVTIYHANLLCSSLDGVDVTQFGKKLNELDNYVHNDVIEKIDVEDVRLQTEIDKEVAARKSAINLLSSNLSIAVNGKYNAMLSAFDAEVSARIHGDKDSLNYTTLTANQLRKEILDEVSARTVAVENEALERISAITNETSARILEDDSLHTEDRRLSGVDFDLSCQIIDTNLRLDTEANTRYTEDTNLDFRIDSLDNMSNERYLSAMSALADHAELNEQQLVQLSNIIDDKVEHDKHYEIIDSDKIQTTYPYVLKDFAINRLEISAVDGYAYHIHDDKEINVGMLVCENGDYDVPLTFFGLQHNDSTVYNALNPNVDIRFNEYGKIYEQGDGSGREYKIKISDGGDFENDYFTLMRDGDIYLPVMFDGRLIGKIHDYDTTISGGAIVKKGLLTITSLDTDIQPFKHVVWRFDVDAGETEYVEDEICVKYNGDNTFSLGFNPVKCQQIKNTDDNYLFAKVYDGGIVRNDALVKNVHVKVGTLNIIDRATDEIIDTPINKYFDLSVSNDYEVEIAPYVYLKCTFNDAYTEYQFDVVEITKHWKYELKLSSDEALSGETVAHVTVGTPNEKIEDNTFSTLSVDFSEDLVPGLLPESFKRIYLLKKDKTVPENLWKDTFENTDGDKIQVTYDGAAVNVKMIKNVSEGVTYIKFLVNTEAPAVGVDKSRVAYTSGILTINTRSYTEWTYLGNTVATIQDERKDAADQIILNIKKNAANEAVFVIPDRLATKKDYSREMLLVVKFMSPDDSRMINVKFVDPSGMPVKYFYNKNPEFLVGVNKYVTIKITEVANRRFLITDWNETEIRAKILALKQLIEDTATALSNDYTTRDNVISNAISNEISARIEGDNYLSNEISVLQDDVGIIKDTIRGGINYKGVVNVIDTDNTKLGSFSLLCNNFHVSSLFFIDFGTAVSSGVDPSEYYKSPNDTYTAGTILSNGFMYLVNKTSNNLSDQWFVDGVQIDDKDYIIINCRPEECKPISALTSADIDVIDALDSNLVTTQLAEQLSNALSVDYVEKISTVKTEAYNEALSDANKYTDSVSAILSTDYCEKDTSVLLSAKNYADSLSNALSIDYIAKVNAEREHTDLISNLVSAELSGFEETTISNINYISNEVSVAIRRDTKGMKFFGDVKLSDTYNVDEIGAVVKEDWSLYGLLKTNAFINVSNKELKAGFTFRAATEELDRTFIAKSPDGGSIELRNNDYIVLNKEISALSCIKVEDINIWKDYDLSVSTLCAFTQNEVKNLSVELSNDVVSLSTRLSGDINKLSDDLSGEIGSLSTKLSGDINSLSTRLSGDINKLSDDLSGDVDALSTALSTDVSAFINGHYERTFDTDVLITGGVDQKFDMLKLVDEATPTQKYTMHLSGGTIVLVPIH